MGDRHLYAFIAAVPYSSSLDLSAFCRSMLLGPSVTKAKRPFFRQLLVFVDLHKRAEYCEHLILPITDTVRYTFLLFEFNEVFKSDHVLTSYQDVLLSSKYIFDRCQITTRHISCCFLLPNKGLLVADYVHRRPVAT